MNVVVLLHGFPDTPSSWDATAKLLADEGHRPVVPWLRGYDPGAIVAGRPYDAETLARDVLELLDEAGAEQGVVVGHDWGATMAYGAATLAPERVRAFVAIAIPHPSILRPSPGALWGVRHFLALKMPWAERTVARNDMRYLQELYERWAPNWSGPDRDASLAAVKTALRDPAALDGALNYYRALKLRPAPVLAKVPTVPGLIVGGTEDLVEPALFEETAKLLPPPSRAVVYEGAGHWPHREAEAAFQRELLAFLSEI